MTEPFDAAFSSDRVTTIVQADARTDAAGRQAEVRLIVNADDFGYSMAISRGIIECASRGIVTATGLFGNAPRLRDYVRMLADVPSLETGVHLTLTHGSPLTREMGWALRSRSGSYPGKLAMATMITLGRISEATLRDELQAQIAACRDQGLSLVFLNSHEHLHMHPRVFPIVAMLASEHGIRHVRVTRPDPVGGGGVGGLVRSCILRAMAAGKVAGDDIGFAGLSQSGRIDVPYLDRLFAALKPGRTYELMCHPGCDDADLARNAKLRRYHDWDLERRSLQDSRLPELLAQNRVRVVRYGALPVSDSRG